MGGAPSFTSERGAGLTVVGVVLLAMLAAAPPFFIRSSDGSAMLATAESLVRRGELAIDDRYLGDVLPLKPSARRGPDGRAYAKYGIGWPLVLAGVLAAAIACGLTPGSPAMTWLLVGVNPLVSAVTAALAFAIARDLGADRRWATMVAIGGSLTTFAWTSGTFDHADPLLAVLMTGAFWCTLRFARTRATRDVTVTGVLLGAAILTKSTMVVLAPAIVAALALPAWRTRRPEAALRTGTQVSAAPAAITAPRWGLLACAPGILAGLGAQLWLNQVRWGSPWASGYNEPVLTGDLGVGLWQLTVGLNRGFLWHAPIAVVGLAAVVAGWRRHQAWSVAVVLGFGSLLVLSARFYEYGGGWVWGPRYLLPVVPALAASAALATRSQGGRWLAGAALAFGLAFTLPGVLIDPSAARTTFGTAYLPEAAGTVRAGDVLRPGVVVEQLRSVDEILPEFSGVVTSVWLLRVLSEPCACDRSVWWCACADGRDMYWNERFRDPPWRARYPSVEARPPYGQNILAPALLGAWYRRAVFDVRAAAPPAAGPRP